MTDKGQEEQNKTATFETRIVTHKQEQPLLTELPTKEKPTISCKYATILILIVLVIICFVFIMIFVYTDLFRSSSSSDQCKTDRKLIIISLDGFRSQYFQNENISTPNLDYIKETGVHIKRLIPTYPSMTFPTHYSIVTGLYPGDHGIVSNSFWDDILQEQFSMSTFDTDGRWFRGEPIWLTHRMPQNIDEFGNIFKSAGGMWVGSDQNASGKGYPDTYMSYNESYPFVTRIDDILNFLQSDYNYRIILGYFHQPDSDGHEYGPNSNEVITTVQQMDALIGYMMDSIKNVSMDLFENTDIIITADHGMSATSMDRLIYVNYTQTFDLYHDTENFLLEGQSTYIFIKINESSIYTVEQVMQLLTEVIYPLEQVAIYNRETIPFEFSQSYNGRIPDIMVVAPAGYLFYFNGVDESQQSWLTKNGHHGYNSSHIDMTALFVARGPSFKVNYTKQMVESVHLYSMFCKIMCNMRPSQNNGSLDQIEDILDL
eukprot:176430_1